MSDNSDTAKQQIQTCLDSVECLLICIESIAAHELVSLLILEILPLFPPCFETHLDLRLRSPDSHNVFLKQCPTYMDACMCVCSYGLCSYGLCSYGLCSYGLCSYGLCSYGMGTGWLSDVVQNGSSGRHRRDKCCVWACAQTCVWTCV